MDVRSRIWHTLHRLGYDIKRPPSRQTVRLLKHFGVDCVIDVGANDGGFASEIRAYGYGGRIVSFEPLNEPFNSLREKASADGHWEAMQYAVGDEKREITINVAGNNGASSSVLPMLDSCLEAAPHVRYVGVEKVNQDRLDRLLRPETMPNRSFLKVDVQGYEHAVLDGATDLFAGGVIVGMQLELSLVPLYAGAMTYREGFDRAESLGMTLVRVDPIFDDPKSGQTLQVDAVFFAM
ncbi:hypothetical protein MANY_48960 [Mycolicibacterium anyangense]|uniref:Methyltransferase FkbM domain-containing protein n=1 Tax=Mycolicibacterium anyangense TaxID=1431246 RepID=A0A6N4WEP8_9MYCO|nr:FkbM family methyltransferase [Mycolicibacterium anyangense]BBZ79559.1 hypothetical protein MANY_48960 [Mycolicibacterium anyangense]